MRCCLLLLISIVVLAAVGLAQQPADPDDAERLIPKPGETADAAQADISYPMSAERYEQLVSYSRFVNIWRFVSFLVGVAILALILFTGWSAKFRDWGKRLGHPFLALWGFFVLFMLADYLLGLPFSIYRGYIVEDNYGFMNQSFWAWWSEDLIGLAIGLVVGVVPVWILYRIINATRRWWLWFSLAAVPMAIVMIVVYPIFISPIFNEYTQLQDKELEAEILTLAGSVDVDAEKVYQVDASKQSSKVNAYVTGLFGAMRIVLYDTLIDNFDTDEIEFVMAHELGHYVMNHMWQGLGLVILYIIFLLWLTNKLVHGIINRFRRRFGFDRLGDVASLPLLLLIISVFSFFFQPIQNGFSRHIEHQADEYAMQITDIPGETAAIAFDKLSVYNLSDPDPHPLVEFWFYSHPSLKSRMEYVRNYRTP